MNIGPFCKEWGIRMNLPGAVQTVARAELYALYFLLNNLEPNSRVIFVTDNEANYKKYHAGEEAALRSMNSDLFKSIFDNIRNKGIDLTVRWMPSHIKEKRQSNPDLVIPGDITELDIEANSWADVLAGEEARILTVPMNVSSTYLYYYHLTRKIQRRIIAILKELPSRPKHIPKVRIPAPSLEECMLNSSHVVFKPDPNGSQIACIRCKQRFSTHNPNVKHWLTTRCWAIGTDADKPDPLPYEHIHLGNNAIHHSHNIYIDIGEYTTATLVGVEPL